MKCQYCGFELPEGSLFCYNCGQKQEGAQGDMTGGEMYAAQTDMTDGEMYDAQADVQYDMQGDASAAFGEEVMGEVAYCPFCGGQNEPDAIYCSSCGQNMTGDGGEGSLKSEKKGVKKPVLIVGGIVAAAIVICVVVKLLGAVFGGGSDGVNYVTYIKDEQISNINMDTRKMTPTEYKGSIGDDFSINDLYGTVQYSEDGKYMCYPSSMEDDTFRLNMIQLGKDAADVVKIENDVTRYVLLDNNKIVYLKDGDTLYINDIKGNKEKIASDVYSFFLDKDQKNIFWTEQDDDGVFDMYYRDIALKKDKTKLMSGYTSFRKISDSLMAFLEDGTLYVIENLGEKQKIAKDVESIYILGDSSDTFYFTTVETETLSAADFVDDDMKAADAAMKEPDPADYVKEDVQKNSDGRYVKTEVTDWDAYYAAWDEYDLKENRDYMREALSETTFDVDVKTLNYYSKGKASVVSENFAFYDDADGTKFMYSTYVLDEMPSIKLSELYDVDDVYAVYSEKRKEVKVNCIADGDKVTTFSVDYMTDCVIDADKGIGYGLMDYDEEDDTYTLVSFDLKDGKQEEIASDVDNIELLLNGDVYYLADVKDDQGDLYCNDKEIDSDVKPYSVRLVAEDSDKIIYVSDYNSEKCKYTLKMYAGKEAFEITDDVIMYSVYGEKQIAVLKDYNLKRGEGDLMLYTGKSELKELDTDVRFLFNATYYY